MSQRHGAFMGKGLFCALLLGVVSTTAGQSLLFEDDFNRAPWQNAMTHAALPAWSVPHDFSPPIDGTPFDVEVRVVGQTFTITVNGSATLSGTDPDLHAGSVGVMSWAQRGGSPISGTECEYLTVEDGAGATLLQETWELPAIIAGKWRRMLTTNAMGAAVTELGSLGDLRWDFHRGAYTDDSNYFTWATNNAPNVDFMGIAVAYDAAGSSAWADYEAKVRLLATDDDGMGVLLRAQDDTNFYRITFVRQAITATNAWERAPQGVSVQKCRNGVWSEIFRDDQGSPLFTYASNIPFDVRARITGSGGTATIQLTLVNDPAGPSPQTITYPDIVDASDPVPAGTAGLHAWGNDATFFYSYGGVSTPFIVTTDATPITLVGDVLPKGYNNWRSTYDPAVPQIAGRPAAWGIRLLSTANLLDPTDGRQRNGGSLDGGTNGDGKYVPYVLVKDGFNAGADYTLRARLRSYDNDGLGLVFGHVDDNNYFRVGFRNEATGSYGFAQGASAQKVVGGVATNIARGVPIRTSLTGSWIRKFQNSALEMSSNANMADGTGQRREFQGPRLVRMDPGATNWTDYTYEAVIEAHDDDGIGLLFRFQDEKNFYRLTFQDEAQVSTGAPPSGISVQRVVNGVYSELFSDIDSTAPGDNDITPLAGFKYNSAGWAAGGGIEEGFKIWRARVICTGGTFRIQIDTLDTGYEQDNYYQATVVDPAPLTRGTVGLHTWGNNVNEFREIKLTLAGQSQPVFTDGMGAPDPKGWVDATQETMSDVDSVLGESASYSQAWTGAKTSGIGIREDLKALGARDNRYIVGTAFLEEGNNTRGTTNFDGPRAVAGESHWIDYTYTVDIQALDNDGIGVLFRYQNEENFYRLMFMSQANNANGGPPQGVSVQKRLAGTYQEVFYNAGFVYRPGQRWRLELQATGADFNIKVTELCLDSDSECDYGGPNATADGVTQYMWSFSDPSNPLLQGKIGATVWGMGDADGRVDEINNYLGIGFDWTKYIDTAGVFDNVRVVGVAGRPIPDLNDDNRVNDLDFILWKTCASGPTIPRTNPDVRCNRADSDGDTDVDMDDFAIFQACYSGDMPLDANCANE